MARGEGKVIGQGNALLGNEEQNATAQQTANQAELGPVESGYTSLAKWGSPELQNEYEQAAMQPVAARTAAARQEAANRVARTNNPAGYGAEEENMAGQQAAQLGEANQRGQLAYQNQKLGAQEAGLKGLASLYGINTDLLSRMMGLPNQTLDVLSGASKKSPMSFGFGPIGVSGIG